MLGEMSVTIGVKLAANSKEQGWEAHIEVASMPEPADETKRTSALCVACSKGLLVPIAAFWVRHTSWVDVE